jgi:porin
LLTDVGVAGESGPTFGDQGALLTNLYWTQYISKNRSAFIAGIVDVTDYLDVYGLYNPWTDFNNLVFHTNPTIPAPAQGLGAAILLMSTPKYYAIAGFADVNGNPQKPDDAFSRFSDGEYFKHIEFGRIGSWGSRYNDNYHISLWQLDEQEDLGVDNDTSVTLAWSKQYDKWLPFLRGGYADKDVGVLKETVSAGFAYALNESGKYLGVGLNWGQAADSDIDQYTLETYLKWKPFINLLIVPGFQYIKNPGYNESKDDIWLVGIKMRVAI